ncbi:MAG: MerR family transcriptional regulator [Ruminiclostridium sp.]|nr:MerR family transcriptional regulator [Ruminiclostridium sp.]
MTIKEIEILTGMERANIRYYEREGLINPNRLDNGYRDYSEADLQLLLRVKLLRSLHISIDEIKELKDGNVNLQDTISKQIKELEKEKQGVSYAQNVCRIMQEDKVSFTDLDAKKYLDGIERTTRETGSLYFQFKGDELPQVFYPWRRFFARMLDISIYNMLWSILLIFVFQVNMANRGNIGNVFDGFISLALMLFFEPLWLHLSGTTPGKAIFGLRIETHDGRLFSYGEGFERTWAALGTGMGYNIPIYNLIRLWKSYKLCNENETQPWDENISYTIKDDKGYRSVILVGAYAVIIAIISIATLTQQFPPNRGELTISEFAENYNYYVGYFDIDFGNRYLDKNGQWREKEFDGTSYIQIGHTEMPEFSYIMEDGYITGITFDIEIKNNQDWLNTYDTQMILTSLALAGAQNEIGLFSKAFNKIMDTISNNSFTSFEFTEAGIEFTCNTQYSGYIDGQTEFLFPDENATENYFRMQYSMNKQK